MWKKKCLSLGYCCCCFVVYSPKAKVWTATAAADGCCCAGCVRIAEQQLLLRSSAGFFFPSRTVAELHRRRHLVCTVHYHRQYSRSVGADFVAVDGVIGGWWWFLQHTEHARFPEPEDNDFIFHLTRSSRLSVSRLDLHSVILKNQQQFFLN